VNIKEVENGKNCNCSINRKALLKKVEVQQLVQTELAKECGYYSETKRRSSHKRLFINDYEAKNLRLHKSF